jgi:autotransporter-associated beta strand protein
MWLCRYALASALLAFAAPLARAQLPAFPGAEGAGAYATGGRAGDVYHVTTTSYSETTPGTFYYGVANAPAAGRTLVFDVSGYIHVPVSYTISKPNLTIAGQTAPGDGVGFRDGTIIISATNIVIRHVRFREARSADAVDLDSTVSHLVMDHCDAMLGMDENLSSFGSPPDTFTFQWCMNAWGIESHSCGGLWDQQRATCHHSLWAHNHTRNPKARPTLLDWVNNVTFDWDIGFIMGDSTSDANWKANVRGCYFVSPPGYTHSVALEKARLQDSNGLPNFSLYLDDCAMDGNGDGVLNVSKTGYALAANSSFYTNATPFAATGVPVTRDGCLTAYKKVLSAAGPLRLDAAATLRDELNDTLARNVVAQRRHHVSSAAGTGASNGGFGTLASAAAPADTDRDGMPDHWEAALGSNPGADDHAAAVPAGAYVAAGYTRLEEYLQFLALPHGTVAKALAEAPTSLEVDLAKYVVGFTNRAPVVFAVSNVVGGAVTALGGGRVRFEPAAGFYGRGRFDFGVTDGDGSAWTQTFAVLVTAAALPRDLLWRGDGVANVFSTNAPTFWDGARLTAFSLGDNVTFDDTGSTSPQVALAGTLMPGSVTVSADKAYALGGSGALSGTMALLQSGTGTLSVACANAFSGGTTVDGGTVRLTDGGSLGSGTNTLLSGAFVNAYPTGTQPAFANPFYVPAGETGTVYLGNRIALSGPFLGGGTLNLVAQTSVGRDDIKGNSSAFSGTVNLLGSGTLRMFINGGAFTGFDGALTTFDAPVHMDFYNNSGGNTYRFGALSGTSASAAIGYPSTGGAANLLVGALNRDTSFAGQIIGTAALRKLGTGSLTLSGASTHTGPTVVSNGTLTVTGSFSASTTTVTSAGTLWGTGRLGAGLTVLSGGTLAPGLGPGSAGTLTVSNTLTLATPTLAFDLSGSPSGTNDRIAMQGGRLAMSGVQNYAFTLTENTLGAGTYGLIEGATDSAAWSDVTHNLPSGTRQSFLVHRSAAGGNPSYVRLSVTGSAASLLWRGTCGSAWDVNATTNWLNGSASNTFYNLDAVRFDDSSTNGAVMIAGSVLPASVTFTNASRAYALGGGAIIGACSLTKSGSGTLSLLATNTYSGGTFIRAGTVALANDTASQYGLGSGAVTLQGGTLSMYSDSASYNSVYWDLDVPAGAAGRLNTDARCFLRGALTGGGALDYYVPYVRTELDGDWSAFTGRINVLTDGDGGDFRINNVYGYAQAALSLAPKVWAYHVAGWTVAVGELSGAAGSVLSSARWLVGSRNTDAAFTGTVSGASSVTKTGAGAWTLAGPCTHTGPTAVEAGTLRFAATASLTNESTLTVQSGAALDLQGAALRLESVNVLAGGALAGCATVDGDWLNAGTAAVTGRMRVLGTLQNSGSLTVSGLLESPNPILLSSGVLRISPTPQPGLYEGLLAGAFNASGASPSNAVQLSTARANAATGWANNTTAIYAGTLWNRASTNVTWTFAESFDDSVLLTIDGAAVLSNALWSTPTLASRVLAPGPHAFELRLGQGDGGAGPSVSGWWTSSSLGVGYDPLGRGAAVTAYYQPLADPGSGSLLTLSAAGGVLAPVSSLSLAAGAALDLGGTAQSVTGLSGSGLVTNGALTVTGDLAPGGAGDVGALTAAAALTLGGTLDIDVAADGACDLLDGRGTLAIGGAALRVRDATPPAFGASLLIARCAPGSLAGAFAATDLNTSRWSVRYSSASGEVRLVRLGLAFMVQ